jgi:CheY-like chemotaxis protein
MSALSLRILMVDDDRCVAKLVADILRPAGHRVEFETDGVAAFERMRLQHFQYDLIITDHRMLVMSGVELVARLRVADFPGRIIVISADITPNTARAYRALGVSELISKPFTVDQLLDAVARVAEKIAAEIDAE